MIYGENPHLAMPVVVVVDGREMAGIVTAVRGDVIDAFVFERAVIVKNLERDIVLEDGGQKGGERTWKSPLSM